MATVTQDLVCYGCGESNLKTVFSYSEPPEGETRFSFSTSDLYRREILRCEACGHFMSACDMDISEMYSSEYVDSTYGSKGIKATFDKIVGLDPTKSDNVGRCDRVHAFCSDHFASRQENNESRRILDVGAGLCVFLHRMKGLGWKGVALDPDPRAATHAKEVVGVETICGDFFDVSVESKFDVISFNKVLEHVSDPTAMLVKAGELLVNDGVVYVEIPDGEFAARAGQGREEFFVEHLHVFSLVSTAMVCERAGFDVLNIERLQEPSTKYTIRAFLSKRPG